MGHTIYLKTDWMKIKTMVDMELLYHTHFKEDFIAQAVRGSSSSDSSFKVRHCWELPHIWPCHCGQHTVTDWGRGIKTWTYQPNVRQLWQAIYAPELPVRWAESQSRLQCSLNFPSALPYLLSFFSTVTDSNKYSAQQTSTQHLFLENPAYDKDPIKSCL